MFSSIFITSFIALVQSEASILGHWHWFNMGYIGIRNMVIITCLYTTQIIWNHKNKDNIEIGKPSRRAGVINGTKRNLRNRPPESQLYLVTGVTNPVILAMCFATK